MAATTKTAMSEAMLKGASEKATLDAMANANSFVIGNEPKFKKAK